MNKLRPDAPLSSDWLSTLLLQDASCDAEPGNDHGAAFLAQVMDRLDTDAMRYRPSGTHATSARLRWLLLGFQGLVVIFLCMAAPAIMQAWLHFAQSPLDGAAWHNPNMWGFVLGLSMLVYGVQELVNLPDELGG